MLTGTIRMLRYFYPRHEIHVAVRAPAGELLIGLPFVDRVISIYEPKSLFQKLSYWIRFWLRLREHKYELVLNFHASFKTALICKGLRTQLVVANHHRLKGKNWFSDIPVPNRGEVKSNINRDLDVLRALNLEVDALDCQPVLDLTTHEKNCAKDLLEKREVKLDQKKLVFLGIGASKITKRWPAEHYAKLVSHLKKTDLEFVIASLPEDQQFILDFQKHLELPLQSKVHYFAKLNLKQVVELISLCKIYVGNDSGLKHAAVALGLPSVTFFGPENPKEWHPYPQDRHPILFIQNLACRTETGKHWCPISECTTHGHQCMKDLAPEKAAKLVEDLICIKESVQHAP